MSQKPQMLGLCCGAGGVSVGWELEGGGGDGEVVGRVSTYSQWFKVVIRKALLGFG